MKKRIISLILVVAMAFLALTVKNKKATATFIPSCSRQHIVCDCDITGATSNSAIGALILNFLKANYGESFADNIYKITLQLKQLIGQNDAIRLVQGKNQFSIGVGNVNILTNGNIEIFSNLW